MQHAVKTQKITYFSGPFCRTTLRQKRPKPANLAREASVDSYDETFTYGVDIGTNWNPERWRNYQWLLDILEEMTEFARKHKLEMTQETLRYSQEICRADLIYHASQPS